jgi:hypothetical protein
MAWSKADKEKQKNLIVIFNHSRHIFMAYF